jgi:hypothetical protein
MTAVIYPLDLHRKFEQRQTARALASRVPGQQRGSPPEGTDACVCGHTAIAPGSSTYTPDVVINHWQCTKCGREWTTSAVEKS